MGYSLTGGVPGGVRGSLMPEGLLALPESSVNASLPLV